MAKKQADLTVDYCGATYEARALRAQRDALLLAAEAVLAHMVASRTDKTSAGGVRSFRYEGTEYEVVTKLRAAVAAAKGGAE